MNLTQISTQQYGWTGTGCKIPAPATPLRCTYTEPLLVAIGAQGLDTASLIAWAEAEYNDYPVQPPKAGIPHFHVSGNGAIYQFVSVDNAPWTVDNEPFAATAPVVLVQGNANPNLYTIFISFESGESLGNPTAVPYPNTKQLASIVEILRDLLPVYPALEIATYRQIHNSYAGSDATDSLLLTAIDDLLAQPVPPLCNTDVCVREAPVAGSLLMTYNPATLCPNGLVSVESIAGQTGFNATDGITIANVPTNGAGVLRFDDTSSVDFTVIPGSLTEARVSAIVKISTAPDNILINDGLGLYVPPPPPVDWSTVDWCLVPLPELVTFVGQDVLVWDEASGCLSRVKADQLADYTLDRGSILLSDGTNSVSVGLVDFDDNHFSILGGDGVLVSLDTSAIAFTISANISPDADNILSLDHDGALFVPRPFLTLGNYPSGNVALAGQNFYVNALDTNTATIEFFAVDASTAQMSVNVTVSGNAGNIIEALPSGLYATIDLCELPTEPTLVTYNSGQQRIVVFNPTTGCLLQVDPAELAEDVLLGSNLLVVAVGSGSIGINTSIYNAPDNIIQFAAGDGLEIDITGNTITYSLSAGGLEPAPFAARGALSQEGFSAPTSPSLDWCALPSLPQIGVLDTSDHYFFVTDPVTGCVVSVPAGNVKEWVAEGLVTLKQVQDLLSPLLSQIQALQEQIASFQANANANEGEPK